jgi:hypothetical protein
MIAFWQGVFCGCAEMRGLAFVCVGGNGDVRYEKRRSNISKSMEIDCDGVFCTERRTMLHVRHLGVKPIWYRAFDIKLKSVQNGRNIGRLSSLEEVRMEEDCQKSLVDLHMFWKSCLMLISQRYVTFRLNASNIAKNSPSPRKSQQDHS